MHELQQQAYAVAARILPRREDAEDVAQEAILRLLKARLNGAPIVPQQAFARRVALRLAIDRLRAEHRRADRAPRELMGLFGAGRPRRHGHVARGDDYGSRAGWGFRRGFTLIELLIVVAIIMMLAAVILPALQQARGQARSVKCAANLRAVGTTLYSFVQAHDDFAAPVIRERDYRWDEGQQIGWDIEVGRWAGCPGPGGIWHCAMQNTSFIGNARALGLDNREARPNGKLYRVGPRLWHETAKLALAYDVQSDRLDRDYRHARNPAAADLSDEMWTPWPRDEQRPVIPLGLWMLGPHSGAYGALFADGHAGVAIYKGVGTVLWSGMSWWYALPLPGHGP